MTDLQTLLDRDGRDLVEAAVRTVIERFPGWEPSAAMLGFGRSTAFALLSALIAGRAATEEKP